MGIPPCCRSVAVAEQLCMSSESSRLAWLVWCSFRWLDGWHGRESVHRLYIYIYSIFRDNVGIPIMLWCVICTRGIRRSLVGQSSIGNPSRRIVWLSHSGIPLGHSVFRPCPFTQSFGIRSFVRRSFGNPVRSGKKKDGRKIPPSSQYAKMRDAGAPRTFAGYSFIHLWAHIT